jgi:hypothetical protein
MHPTKISDGLEGADRLILVLTQASVKSGWVGEEWKAAYWEQVSTKTVRVIPILVEKCEIPILLRTKRYVDFTNGYEPGFEDLLSNLNGSATGAFVGPDDGDPVSGPTTASPVLSVLSPGAAQLADCMSDISEKCYYASWLDGLEYILWDRPQTA